ncbi:MAG: 5'-methylthioadenosine/adenosylhomocysteine nucleosidase [Breznakia sp.]
MIGIIGAMQMEVDAIKAYMKYAKERTCCGIHFTTGKIDNKEIVLTRSGVGKVCASMTTAILLEQFEITTIINVGTAGGLLKEQKVLDVVIAQKCIQHDYDTSILDGEAGKGVQSVCDEQLLALCKQIFVGETPTIWYGDIASGDQFIAKQNKLEQIKKTFPSVIACEMEAAAICFVCNQYRVPAILIRSLSDNVYHPHSDFDFQSYAVDASRQSAKFCVELIVHLQ